MRGHGDGKFGVVRVGAFVGAATLAFALGSAPARADHHGHVVGGYEVLAGTDLGDLPALNGDVH